MSDIHEVTEPITLGPARALAGLLGVPEPGEELPLLWHLVYREPGANGQARSVSFAARS